MEEFIDYSNVIFQGEIIEVADAKRSVGDTVDWVSHATFRVDKVIKADDQFLAEDKVVVSFSSKKSRSLSSASWFVDGGEEGVWFFIRSRDDMALLPISLRDVRDARKIEMIHERLTSSEYDIQTVALLKRNRVPPLTNLEDMTSENLMNMLPQLMVEYALLDDQETLTHFSISFPPSFADLSTKDLLLPNEVTDWFTIYEAIAANTNTVVEYTEDQIVFSAKVDS